MFYLGHCHFLASTNFKICCRPPTYIPHESVERVLHMYSTNTGAKNRRLCRISSKRKCTKSVDKRPILNIFEILAQTIVYIL